MANGRRPGPQDEVGSAEVVLSSCQELDMRRRTRPPAKCHLPPGLLGPGDPSPLKPEEPEWLRQCERWSRVGTGTRRAAASHQCWFTDGSIQTRQVPQGLSAASRKLLRLTETETKCPSV
ncbi:unnamed protein product [Pleuronectes platessa]|uniref:Uncharacterized protein n=1 Tax=Pleuronectes platessa TaxID=8262 RepID=A0A9N7U192_PLEPL|nr:unnamed protein product [Pleuronectes platessa]